VTCSPTTTYATYNIINAPKQLCVSPNTGHWLPTEHVTKMWDWIIDELKK
jgi:cephalosporin-C deacetylase-like acetyl esterase